MTDHFEPEYLVEQRGGKAGECYLCGGKDGDRASHMIHRCMDPRMKKLRSENESIRLLCKQREFVRLWTNESEKVPKGKKKEGMEEMTHTTIYKIRKVLDFVKSVYQLRQEVWRSAV